MKKVYRYGFLVFFLLGILSFNASAQLKTPPSVESMSSMYSCYPAHKKWTDKDDQQYAKMFFKFYCDCKKGVANKQQEQQMIAGMRQMQRYYNDFRNTKNTSPLNVTIPSKCTIRGGAGAASGAQNSEIEKMRRTIANYKKAIGIYNQAKNRADGIASLLSNMAPLDPNASADEIMRQFNQMMLELQNMDRRLREEINMGYLNNTVGVIQDYQSGNVEGAGWSALATLGSIADNEEAKEQVRKKQQAIIAEKNRALENAANRMINLNNDALQKWLELAANVLEEDKERFYMQKAFYHSCYARSVSNNFNYSNTAWARPNCGNPQQPIFKTYYNPRHEQHYEAALRKSDLYKEYGNEVLYQGAVGHISAAISQQPKNAQYFLAKGRITNPKEIVSSLSSYVAAYSLDSKMFDEQLMVEMQLVQAQANAAARDAILNSDLELVRDFVDAQLFDIIVIEGLDMFTYAAYSNNSAAQQIIDDRHLAKYSSSGERRDLYQTALVEAAAANSTQSLSFLLNRSSEGVDFRYKKRYLIDYAAEGDAPNSFFKIYQYSKRQSQIDRKYAKDLVYLKAFALNDQSRARDLFCALDAATMESHSKNLIDQIILEPSYLELFASCGEAQDMVRGNAVLQEKTQTLALSYLGRAPIVQSEAQVQTSVFEGMSREEVEAYAERLAANPELINTLNIENTPATQIRSGPAPAEQMNKLISYEVLQPQFLAEHKNLLTERAVTWDNPALFQTLQKRGLESAQLIDGRPIAFLFATQGSSILKSGLVNHLDFQVQLEGGEGIAHQLAFVNCPHTETLLPKLNLNQQGPHGWTALHYASRENNLGLVKTLVRYGANPEAEDEWGRTAKNIAKERLFEDMLDYLKSL